MRFGFMRSAWRLWANLLAIIALILVTSASFAEGHYVDCPIDIKPGASWDPKPHFRTQKIRIGVIQFVSPSPYQSIIQATIDALKAHFGDDRVEIHRYTLNTLKTKVIDNEVDVFIASSGFFLSMLTHGARDLATAVTETYPDPNNNDGTAIVTLASRSDLQSLRDLQNQRLVTSSAIGFTGYYIPMGELYKAGLHPESTFKSERFIGAGVASLQAIEALKKNEADVAFLRLCLLEAYLKRHPEDTKLLKVLPPVEDKPSPTEACQRSTSLYPALTIASTPSASPDLSREVTKVLLSMPPTPQDKAYWGVATDYSRVQTLFKNLKLGPYLYLRNWTLERLWSEYSQYIIVLCALLILLLAHATRTTYLVRKRTESLTAAIEKQKELQTQVRHASERLEHMGRVGAISQLSTIFAHEIRQPLAALSLYTSTLQKFLTRAVKAPDTLETAMQITHRLEKELERADRIVEQVRGYAQSKHPKRESVNLRLALLRAISDLQVAKSLGTQITYQVEHQPHLRADPLEIELILLNLIKNACEAVGAQGHVHITLNQTDEYTSIEVCDDGPPLSDEAFSKLNEALHSTKSTGMGLGLSIVTTIVERMGGKITFKRHQKGDRFPTGLSALITFTHSTIIHTTKGA